MGSHAKLIAIGGLVQVVMVTYGVLVVAGASKFGDPEVPASTLPAFIETYGAIFYLVPLLWTLFAGYIQWREKPGTDASNVVEITWVLTTLVLLGGALSITCIACGAGRLVTFRP